MPFIFTHFTKLKKFFFSGLHVTTYDSQQWSKNTHKKAIDLPKIHVNSSNNLLCYRKLCWLKAKKKVEESRNVLHNKIYGEA